MNNFSSIEKLLSNYSSPKGAKDFFKGLGYNVIEPFLVDIDHLPEGAKVAISAVYQLVHIDGFFRIFHIELKGDRVRRTDIRKFLEAFYRHYPQGENLFVFTKDYEELYFVSPRRIIDPRDNKKVRLWIRTLPVRREKPYRTDLEILDGIRADGLSAQEIWKRVEEFFSVEKVSEKFFDDYVKVFNTIQEFLYENHRDNGKDWARDYTHEILNRIMFIYFIARKGWLLGPDGKPDRDFMKHFWEAYKDSREKDKFHKDYLSVLFFSAFNGRWQNRDEYKKRFPEWLINSLAQAPYLNGGLYRRTELDEKLQRHIPDEFFELLFERWPDNTFPGLFERYNFTVVESGRFDEEVAVDPEMLGTVYESLVNTTYEDIEAGIFYTGRTEIDLMCRLSLVDWLSNQLGLNHKNLFYRWIFAFSEDEKKQSDDEVKSEGLLEKLNELIRKVRICDPACGSGSFLVGMLLILDDLQSRVARMLNINETPYERRKRIIQDQLYGVDVMEWAVRVAELRLWLQLVVETELDLGEIKFKPLLPNLNFKLRPGDSLLQTVGDIDLSHFRRSESPISPSLKRQITEFKKKKAEFFRGAEKISEEMLKKEEQNLFHNIISERMKEIQDKITQKEKEKVKISSQTSMYGGKTKDQQEKERRIDEEIKELRQQLGFLEKVLNELKPMKPTPFVWDIAFVEVFEDENPGFDIVIGNPPYVRQEEIRDYLGRFSRSDYLTRLNESLRTIYPGFMGNARRISGRADYYVYFYLHSLSLLADKGTFCFITSNSWLDVDFGKDLQEFFLRFGNLKMIIDNQKKRSFAHADVNTIIALAGTPERKEISDAKMKEKFVRFVAFKVPFEDAMDSIILIEDEKLYKPMFHFSVLSCPEFRSITIDYLTLYKEGLAEDKSIISLDDEEFTSYRYAGNKWGGKYLRAPEIYWKILEKGKDKLVRLGDIAEVRFGIKTGANEFFYLKPIGMSVKEVVEIAEKDPNALIPVQNGAGWSGEIEAQFLKPVIKSPRELKTIMVKIEDLNYLVFMCHKDKEELKGTKALEYIEWGEKKEFNKIETVKNRRLWYSIVGKLTKVLMLRASADRPAFYISSLPIAHDQTFYSLIVKEEHYNEILLGLILNNSFTNFLAREILSGASAGLGLGVKWTAVYEAEDLLIIGDFHIKNKLEHKKVEIFNRSPNSIFTELGFDPNKPIREQEPNPLPDRKALDDIVFDVLGLTEEERKEVYWAVAELVKARLDKAKSVEEKRNKKHKRRR